MTAAGAPLAPARPDQGAPPGPEAHRRRADIQGMRALAVLMVVAFHAGLDVPGGYTGVDVFFVISGFVITAMLLRELSGTGRVSFAAFYSRRIRRILPASALAISFVALASTLAISPAAQATTAHTGMAGSVFVANVFLARARNGYFDVLPTSNPLLHIWSLSVEEQFYVIFPTLLVVGALVARR
ncbi:MAG: acyltransferase, partial [Leifsonia sp.]